jgi:peptide/nickel transport system ATP-binding protein
MPDEPVLQVTDLRVETAQGDDIVAGVSFQVRRGEVVALVGESGCGKTSTALALLAHARKGARIAAGSVQLDGIEITRLSRGRLRALRGAQIAYVPQDPTSGLNPRHRVGSQVGETLSAHGRDASGVDELFAPVGLPTDREFLRRYPFELSGGQQQRVAIAMALACRPSVVVLDEPTTGLDVTTQARILKLLRRLGDETGTAFVYVTHDLAVVNGLANRVAVMYAGRIVEAGPCERVLHQPSHPYTSMLLASVPRLAIRRHLAGIPGTAPPPDRRPAGCTYEPRCPLAIARCRIDFPAETQVARDHTVRCWRASEMANNGSQAATPIQRKTAQPEPILILSDLVASYRHGRSATEVLHGVSFSLSAGGCLAVVGESGSGKTTLGRCVVGLHSPDSGAVRLNGSTLAPVARDRSRIERRQVQIIFQNPDRSLNPRQTVGQAIGRPLRLFGWATGAVDERRQARELLDRVRLQGAVLDRYPYDLSGGEKQRVAIARALAARPIVLVSDEITSSLDVSIQAAIVGLLDELRQDGLSVLFITHNLALVNSIADQVLVLQSGVVREHGERDVVIGRPQDPYTRDLLAAAPDLEPPDTGTRLSTSKGR